MKANTIENLGIEDIRDELEKAVSHFDGRISGVSKLIGKARRDIGNNIRRLTPLPLIQFEASIVNHCILNCKGCDHFSPLADEWFADIEVFAKDMQRMSKVFGGQARYIYLIGGEPLLHPEASEFIKVARESFKNTCIKIWTNGLLLPKMNNDFWKSCRETGAIIHITKYPVNFDYQTAQDATKSQGVRLEFWKDGLVMNSFMSNSFDFDGMCDPVDSFMKCNNANNSITLSQGGNLYPCDKPPHIDLFNRYFGKNIEASNKDCVNIHDDVSAEKILEFLARPIPMCRYCNLSKRVEGFEWGASNREISEWT